VATDTQTEKTQSIGQSNNIQKNENANTTANSDKQHQEITNTQESTDQKVTDFPEPSDPDYIYLKSMEIERIILKEIGGMETQYYKEYFLSENFTEMKAVIDFVDSLAFEKTKPWWVCDGGGCFITVYYTDGSSVKYIDYGRGRINISGDYDRDGISDSYGYSLIGVDDNTSFRTLFETLK
jgi:hypothetical protein